MFWINGRSRLDFLSGEKTSYEVEEVMNCLEWRLNTFLGTNKCKVFFREFGTVVVVIVEESYQK